MKRKEFKNKLNKELCKKGWSTDAEGMKDLLNDVYESQTIKNLILFGVSQKRELLNSFLDWEDSNIGKQNNKKENNAYISEFLKTILQWLTVR